MSVALYGVSMEANQTDTATDDTAQGAIDNEFDENLRDAREALEDELADVQTEPMAGGVAIDLVTRQPLFIRRVVADSVVEYYEDEDFDLNSYKSHPYLPVSLEDTVYECVFVPTNPEQAHSVGNTYSFPRGRLMHVPVEQAWEDA